MQVNNVSKNTFGIKLSKGFQNQLSNCTGFSKKEALGIKKFLQKAGYDDLKIHSMYKDKNLVSVSYMEIKPGIGYGTVVGGDISLEENSASGFKKAIMEQIKEMAEWLGITK